MNEVITVDRRVFAAKLQSAGNNLKNVSVPSALSNRRSADEFVRLITDRRTRAVENIVAIGQHLREAKEELDRRVRPHAQAHSVQRGHSAQVHGDRCASGDLKPFRLERFAPVVDDPLRADQIAARHFPSEDR